MNGYNITYYNNSYLIKKYEDMEFKYEGKRLVEIKEDNDEEITYYKYYYNLDGLRIKKEVITEYSDYRDPEVEVTQYYYYEDNKLICEYRNDLLRIDYLYDINDNLFGFILNDNRYYYIRDCMQNILGIIDNNGNIIVKYNYNAFGRLISITGSNTAIGSLNPFRYKGYYYDSETCMYYCKSRYYNPLWCRWLTPDSVDYLNPNNINGLNLYTYCNNNPVMYSDGDGHYSKPADWLNFANVFGLTSAIGQLMINGAYIGSYFRIANAVRPANIGVGTWNKGRLDALKSFGDIDAPKFQKASNILGAITVGVQVLGAGISDYNRGYSTDRIISNAVVNTAIYSATTLGYSYIGGLVGSLIPIPIVGTAIGTAVGYVAGVGIDFLLELEINGKSIIDYVRDGIYDFWKIYLIKVKV